MGFSLILRLHKKRTQQRVLSIFCMKNNYHKYSLFLIRILSIVKKLQLQGMHYCNVWFTLFSALEAAGSLSVALTSFEFCNVVANL